MGYPNRPSFLALGGVREDIAKITNPKVQVGAATINDVTWQTAGAGVVGPIVSLTIDETGQKVSGGEAWNNDDDATKRVEITHDATGEYTITAQASEYPDWSETPYPVIFTGAIVTPQGEAPLIATYKLVSATSLIVYLFDPADALAPIDGAFTVDIK